MVEDDEDERTPSATGEDQEMFEAVKGGEFGINLTTSWDAY